MASKSAPPNIIWHLVKCNANIPSLLAGHIRKQVWWVYDYGTVTIGWMYKNANLVGRDCGNLIGIMGTTYKYQLAGPNGFKIPRD